MFDFGSNFNRDSDHDLTVHGDCLPITSGIFEGS